MANDRIESKIIGEIPLGENLASETYTIEAVHREGSDITAYKLNNWEVIDGAEAVRMCNLGQLPGYMVSVSKFGEEFIRGINDGDESNNLTSKPGF